MNKFHLKDSNTHASLWKSKTKEPNSNQISSTRVVKQGHWGESVSSTIALTKGIDLRLSILHKNV